MALHPSVSAEQYLASHDFQKEESRAQVFVDQHERNLYATLKITLDALAKSHPEACKALQFLSLLHHNTVPFPYLVSFLKRMDLKITTDEVLSILYDRSLLEVQKNGKPEKIRLSMHQLIHDLISTQIPLVEKKQLMEKAIQVVAEPFAGQMDIFTNRIVEPPEHLMQAQALSEQARKIDYHSIPLFSLRIRMLASFMSGFRDFETARQFVSIVLGDQEKLQTQSLPGTSGVLSSTIDGLSLTDQAFFENNLGYLELMSRNYEKALKHYKRSFEVQKKLPEVQKKLPEAQKKMLGALKNVVEIYSAMGDLQKAEKMIEEGKKLLPFSQSNVDKERFYAVGWAKFLLIKGDLEEALKIQECALRLRQKNPDFPAYKIHNFLQKAEILAKIGRREESLYLLDHVDKEIQVFFRERKKKSPRAAWSMLLRAFNSLGEVPKTTESIALVENALEIYEHGFQGKKKDRMQGLAYFVRAKLYEQQVNNQKTLDAYRQSEAVYDAVLKEKGIDDVSRLWSAMALLGLKSKDITLAQTYLRRHIDTFGRNHPRTIEIVEYADKNGISVPYS